MSFTCWTVQRSLRVLVAMPMRKYRPTSTTSASCSSSSSSNSTITNLTVTNVTPTITTLAGATSLTPAVPQHHHQVAVATAATAVAGTAQRVVHHHHHHAANCNLNLITNAAATAGAYQPVNPQPQPQPAPLQRATAIHPGPPPILDPLPLCLDANGTYLCTAYNPRCYIIQKVIVSHIIPLNASFSTVHRLAHKKEPYWLNRTAHVIKLALWCSIFSTDLRFERLPRDRLCTNNFRRGGKEGKWCKCQLFKLTIT